MQKNRWQKVEEIFNRAAVLPLAERREFIEDACGDDEELCREVLNLVEADSAEENFLDAPVFSLGAQLLEADEFLQKDAEFASYRIKKLLGRGGMGAVYLAEDVRLERLVALKILPPSLGENTESVLRFRQEARHASAISHQNVAHIYEFGEAGERYFLAMEYVEGKTLRQLLKENAIDVSRALEIALQIADALVATHKRGIIHRDIKPENVIINESGLVKVLDFGLAKLHAPQVSAENEKNLVSLETIPGMIIGTTAYMSPEQVRGQPLDARTDLWSFGVVLFEMLAGKRPFTGATSSDIQAAILLKDAPLIELPTKTATLVSKLLKKDLGKRCDSAVQLAKDLTDLKQSLESVEIPSIKNLSDVADNQSEKIAFLTTGKQFWKKQSLPRKGLLLACLIGFLTFSFGIFAQYFSRLYANKSPKSESFSPDSRGKLQLSTLFSTRRKPKGEIKEVNFSPDGKSIAFTLSGNDLGDIYVKQIDKGEPIKLTDGKTKNQSPLWSLDGQQIAFVSDREDKLGIWSVSASGGTPVFLASLEDIGLTCYLRKWSNDGRRIFYESCKKLFTIELASGQISEIPLPEVEMVGDFNISTDEKMLTFVAIENQKQQIFTQSLETGEVRAVLKSDNHNWTPVFFPDKQRIAYSSNQNGISQIYVTDLSGSEPSQITFGDINSSVPIISPDGMKMVYVSETDEANIFSLELKTGRETAQTSNTKMQLFPNVSPNNEAMVFQTTENSSKIYSSLLKIKTLGKESEPNQINLTGGEPQWSPQNDTFAFLKQTGIDKNIWKANINNLEEKQLTFGGIVVEGSSIAPFNLLSIPFDWSPDGKKIVYSSKQSGFYNLWTIDENGDNAQMLTNNGDNQLRFSSPLWSPNGNQIAYISRTQLEAKKAQYGISVLSNGETKNLYENDSVVRLLGWLEDGNGVFAAVEHENDADLFIVSTASKTKPVANLKEVYFHGIAMSPDGQKIAYSARRNGVNNVFVFSTSGKETQLTSNLEDTLYYSGITWSSDGANLYYSKQSGGIQISMISDSNSSE